MQYLHQQHCNEYHPLIELDSIIVHLVLPCTNSYPLGECNAPDVVG